MISKKVKKPYQRYFFIDEVPKCAGKPDKNTGRI